MSQDDDKGTLRLNDYSRLEVDWKGVGKERIFRKGNAVLRQCTEALGGTFVEDLIWSEVFGRELVSVHPLGGCIMGDTAAEGVVNHKGQVFDPTTGGVHPGLYITDGSVVPTTLGVNPLLTISRAISERNMALLIEENGWTLDYRLPSRPRAAVPAHSFHPTI